MRKIVHIDADSFYASVEMREDPSLRGRPLAVGGSAERRGVIATCNYEARRFGIHSAMASAQALRRCPELIILPPRFSLYREVSRAMHAIFSDYSAMIEPLSLDEAYLDVSAARHCHGSATLIAAEIRQRVASELDITVSAGVAPNKFLAKVASDWRKPDGLFVIRPEEVAEFVLALPVKRINGVGKVTEARLAALGIHRCADLQRCSVVELQRHFGKYGARLFELAHGRDDRPVSNARQRKSLSVERTYARDLSDLAAMDEALQHLLADLRQRFAGINAAYRVKGRTLKIRFADFSQTTIEALVSDHDEELFAIDAYRRLMQEAWQRRSLAVRLLGVGLRLQPADAGKSDTISGLAEKPPAGHAIQGLNLRSGAGRVSSPAVQEQETHYAVSGEQLDLFCG